MVSGQEDKTEIPKEEIRARKEEFEDM